MIDITDIVIILGVLLVVWAGRALLRFTFGPPPIKAKVPEYTPEAPTIPTAIIVHLSLGDRIKDRAPWESVARAEKAGMN